MKWADIQFQLPDGPWVEGDEAYKALRKACGYICRNAGGHVILNTGYSELPRDENLVSDTESIKKYFWTMFSERIRFIDEPPRSDEPSIAVRRGCSNTLDVVYEYRVSLKLGNIDALFPPLPSDGEPWKDAGVRQRLQVLGFLYAPLTSPEDELKEVANAGWEYYRRIHGGIEDGQLLELLANEVNNNLVCAAFPGPGEVFMDSRLPEYNEFGAIRIPGGYCITTPKLGYWETGEPSAPAQHVFPIGGRRDDAIKEVWAANPMLGKIPLVATVEKRPRDADHWRPVGLDELEVYFSLVDPAELPTDPQHPFHAPVLRDTVMDYSVDPGALTRWHPTPPAGLNESEWDAGKKLARELALACVGSVADEVDRLTKEADAAKSAFEDQKERYDSASKSASNLRLQRTAANSEALKLKAAEKAAFDAKREHESRDNRGDDYDAVLKQLGKRIRAAGRALKDANDTFVFEGQAELASAEAEMAEANAEMAKIRSRKIELEGAPWKFVHDTRMRMLKEKEGDVNDPVLRAAEEVFTMVGTPISPLNVMLLADWAKPELEGTGPRKFVAGVMDQVAAESASDDPQRVNAPAKWSGKGGLPLADSIFSIKPQIGFHDRGAGFAVAEAADSADHPHAVKARTNSDGAAGVVFLPSRCGGDRYRLRVYVRPSEPHWCQAAIMGTLVVWQNIRIHKLLRHAPEHGQSDRLAKLLAEADVLSGASQFPYPGAYTSWAAWFEARGAHSSGVPVAAIAPDDPRETLPPNDPGKLSNKLCYRPVEHTFVGLADNLRAGFIELQCDHDRATSRITQEDLDRAFSNLKTAWLKKGKAIMGINVDWDTLAFVDATSPFLLNIRHYLAYNADLAEKRKTSDFAGYPDLNASTAEKLITDFAQAHGIQPLAEALMDRGLSPGLTIVQVAHGDTWDPNGFDIAQIFTSGWAGAARGCFVFYSTLKYKDYMCYSASSNIAHELGHVLGLPHQPGNPGGDEHMHEKQVNGAFTKPADGENNCLMGYSGCYGEFCGKCVLALRGLRLQQTAWRDPEQQTLSDGVREDGI